MPSSHSRPTFRLRPLAAALTALFAFSACTTQLPYHWTEPAFGFEVRTDFPPLQVEALFDQGLTQKFAALCALYDVTSLSDLCIYVHDHDTLPRGEDAFVAGWHDSGEIHLMAHWSGANLTMPDIATVRHLEHEFVHALHARSRVKAPRWLEEGLCEVLSSSSVDASGELVLMPDIERECALRDLRAAGRWLPAAEFLKLSDDYPKDPDQLAPMYAQATSFTWYLLSDCEHPTQATIAELASRSPEQFAAQFAAWEARIDATSITALLAPFASAADARTRSTVAHALGKGNQDDVWWSVAATLLTDEDVVVRRSARIAAIYRPTQDPAIVARYRGWRDSTDRNLHLAALAALAQCGDSDAAVRFCRTLGGAGDQDWEQPLLWMVLILPRESSTAHTYPDPGRLLQEPTYLHDFASALADEYERLQPRLEWDAQALRYRLR